ncbi:MAG: hypothetical protein NUV80_06060 [Candidatus Berkelbacteria bacterium]|nr:hypothetical protein [Candidatus Berkelbacteria bacterium]
MKPSQPLMKGNEQDCICHKPNGKHTKNCDAYRLSEFEKKIASIPSQPLRGKDE